MANLATILSLSSPFAWPLLGAVLLLAYRKRLAMLLDAAIARIQGGDSFTIGMITLGQSTGPLKEPLSDEDLSDDHLALIHRSWHDGRHDERFGRQMNNIHVIVFGTREALERVNYVVYQLDRAYPSPVRLGGAADTNFELKELANGYSLIRADVYVRGQRVPVRLSRLIDLTATSERLKGSVYLR